MLTYAAAVALLQAHARRFAPPDPAVLVKIGTFPPIVISSAGVRTFGRSEPIPGTTITIADEPTLTTLRDTPGKMLLLILTGKVKTEGEKGAATALAVYLATALKGAKP